MKYYYLYNVTLKKATSAGYLKNKLALYDNLDSAKRGLRQYPNIGGWLMEIREVEL